VLIEVREETDDPQGGAAHTRTLPVDLICKVLVPLNGEVVSLLEVAPAWSSTPPPSGEGSCSIGHRS
jgi:hypothetical protein